MKDKNKPNPLLINRSISRIPSGNIYLMITFSLLLGIFFAVAAVLAYTPSEMQIIALFIMSLCGTGFVLFFFLSYLIMQSKAIEQLKDEIEALKDKKL